MLSSDSKPGRAVMWYQTADKQYLYITKYIENYR